MEMVYAAIRVGCSPDKGVVPVILKGEQPLDLRPIVPDITADVLAGGALANVDTSRLSPLAGDFTYLAPIDGIRQIAATGFNYKKHIEEFHMKPPTEPEVFLKGIGSLTGPFDPIFRGPNKGVKLDWEMELTIVIGREAKDITPPKRPTISSAMSVSMTSRTARPRSMRRASSIWSAPIAAGLLPDRALSHDRRRRHEARYVDKTEWEFEQHGNTSDMLFSVYEMVAYFSAHMVSTRRPHRDGNAAGRRLRQEPVYGGG